MLEPPAFLFQTHVLTIDEPRLVDLLHDVSEIVGAPLGIGAPLGEIRYLANDGGKLLVGGANLRRVVSRARKRVEDAALRIVVEQVLGFVLAVQVDEQPSDFREESSAHGGTVDPAAAAAGRDLALEDDERFLDVESMI